MFSTVSTHKKITIPEKAKTRCCVILYDSIAQCGSVSSVTLLELFYIQTEKINVFGCHLTLQFILKNIGKVQFLHAVWAYRKS